MCFAIVAPQPLTPSVLANSPAGLLSSRTRRRALRRRERQFAFFGVDRKCCVEFFPDFLAGGELGKIAVILDLGRCVAARCGLFARYGLFHLQEPPFGEIRAFAGRSYGGHLPDK